MITIRTASEIQKVLDAIEEREMAEARKKLIDEYKKKTQPPLVPEGSVALENVISNMIKKELG